jgi:hypothetical protein
MGEWLSPDRISVAAVASVRPNNSVEPLRCAAGIFDRFRPAGCCVQRDTSLGWAGRLPLAKPALSLPKGARGATRMSRPWAASPTENEEWSRFVKGLPRLSSKPCRETPA